MVMFLALPRIFLCNSGQLFSKDSFFDNFLLLQSLKLFFALKIIQSAVARGDDATDFLWFLMFILLFFLVRKRSFTSRVIIDEPFDWHHVLDVDVDLNSIGLWLILAMNL